MISRITGYLFTLLLLILVNQTAFSQSKLSVYVFDINSFPQGKQGDGAYGIVSTLNSSVNNLFASYGVTMFYPLYPSVYRPDASANLADLKNYYIISCECDTNMRNNLRDVINADTLLYGMSFAYTYTDPVLTYTASTQPKDDNIRIYPNPAIDRLVIEGVVNSPIIISNTLGKVIYSGVNANSIDVSNFAKGIYFIQLTDEHTQSTVTKRVIVN